MALKRNDVTAVGLQYAPAGIQMTIYNNSMREPGTVGADSDDSDNGMIPLPQEAVREAEGITEGTEALSAFLKEQFTHILDTDDFSMLRIMVTIPENHDSAWEKMPGALLGIGVERKHIYLQDYLSSFYFYSVNQKKDLWNQDVALLEFEGGEMIGYVLSIDRTKSPAVALVQQCASTRVDRSLREEETARSGTVRRTACFLNFSSVCLSAAASAPAIFSAIFTTKAGQNVLSSICAITAVRFRGKICIPEAPAMRPWNGQKCW